MGLRLKECPTTTAAELSRFGVCVSRQLVSLVLRKRLGYSWKRTRKRGPVGVGWKPVDVDMFKHALQAAYANKTLSAWDESGFDQRVRPVYGYAPVGQRAIVNVPRTVVTSLQPHCQVGESRD